MKKKRQRYKQFCTNDFPDDDEPEATEKIVPIDNFFWRDDEAEVEVRLHSLDGEFMITWKKKGTGEGNVRVPGAAEALSRMSIILTNLYKGQQPVRTETHRLHTEDGW